MLLPVRFKMYYINTYSWFLYLSNFLFLSLLFLVDKQHVTLLVYCLWPSLKSCLLLLSHRHCPYCLSLLLAKVKIVLSFWCSFHKRDGRRTHTFYRYLNFDKNVWVFFGYDAIRLVFFFSFAKDVKYSDLGENNAGSEKFKPIFFGRKKEK